MKRKEFRIQRALNTIRIMYNMNAHNIILNDTVFVIRNRWFHALEQSELLNKIDKYFWLIRQKSYIPEEGDQLRLDVATGEYLITNAKYFEY